MSDHHDRPATELVEAAPRRAPRVWVRVLTAAALFDGHDASINVIRRMLQAEGAEVIHLGHDRSVGELVAAAIQEDVDAVAVSSYQGGHLEFFKFLVDELRRRGSAHIRVYGGGGGTILPEEIAELQAYGVAHIFSPEDGRRLGLKGMARHILDEVGARAARVGDAPDALLTRLASQDDGQDDVAIARMITWIENHQEDFSAELADIRKKLEAAAQASPSLTIGLTGTGGAGKSSVLDELVRRFRLDNPLASVGILLIDPTRRNSRGALLGDRIRLNAIHAPGIYVRSLATRREHRAISAAVGDAIGVLRAARFDLVIVETSGIGQSDSEIVEYVDVPVYVMTPEYGAPSQLEKIDMLEMAELVILNKADRRGAQDALRDIRKQWRRNTNRPALLDAEVPVVATVASQADHPGLNDAYDRLMAQVAAKCGKRFARSARAASGEYVVPTLPTLIDPARDRYLAEIADTVRAYHQETERLAERAADARAIERTISMVGAQIGATASVEGGRNLDDYRAAALAELDPQLRQQLEAWPGVRASYESEEQFYTVRGKQIPVANHAETLSHSKVPKVALPRTSDWGELTRYLRSENLPGRFPFTAGVYPFKRQDESPVRMFAGEGPPESTNRRFHYLAKNQDAARLSTAFDSVTLYGRDPHQRPDIYGKVGNSGVSICTVDDAKKLYSGFDLCSPSTSVSMTINGPAPMILSFFLNAAIDQQVEQHLVETGKLDEALQPYAGKNLPRYSSELAENHSGLGLRLLGIPGDEVVDAETYQRIRRRVLSTVRGTVQADILKEDQAQNTCIFSTDFALKMMGDIQEYFVANQVRNFYSVSISGYHIAEAGANPISQLAFTLANGFTYVEHYLKRGMKVDDFAPNLSFFFSNGLDAEYTVIGRVARRLWAIAMRERYGASERSQLLKYHVQTSGRSLHAQEMAFNDIRTTLQALLALEDNANSLHTNAYDEAVTTPTQESVRRAVAIQLIIGKEFGLSKNENPLQGSYAIEYLTNLVEQAVLDEFHRLSQRGGVLGAMETGYQRSRIQEESMHYESLKHSGELPIVGVNTFESPDPAEASARPKDIARSTDEEKQAQLRNLECFKNARPEKARAALARLQQVALARGNVFTELMETVKYASLGQISDALFAVGGRYRRSM
ncbi:MAG: methylmalonyl-CoA mutase [Acidobacteria bacterium]|nr:methylmalonyl-CoA mutase [Acidobacteriota bacterium]